MSDTPRTDGMTFVAQIGMMPPYDTVPAEFARQLERELNAAKANPIDEAVRRMEAVPVDDLRNEYMETLDDELHSFEDRDKPFTTEDLVNTALEAVRTRLIKAAKGEQL